MQITTLRQTYKNDNASAGGTALGNVLKLVNKHLQPATNKPTGADLGKVMLNVGENINKVPNKALKLNVGVGAGEVLVTLHGETHYKPAWKGAPKSQVFEPDHERGQAVIDELVTGGENPGLIVFEKGLTVTGAGGGKVPKYALGGFATGAKVDEDDVISLTLGIPERSNFIAGFVFLCLAGGPQNVADKVLLLFGAEHADIVDGIEYFANHSDASWFQKRPRSYAVIRSLAH